LPVRLFSARRQFSLFFPSFDLELSSFLPNSSAALGAYALQVASTPPLRFGRKRCSASQGSNSGPQEGRDFRDRERRKKMRILSLAELSRLSKPELLVLLRTIAAQLPHLREGSPELRAAHQNLLAIRTALARPACKPG
jgi:hypothetical protein